MRPSLQTVMRRSRERVTLVIEPDSLRLLTTEGRRIKRWGSAPIPQRTVTAEGGVIDRAALATRLTALWESHSHSEALPRSHVRVAIPGHRIVSKMIVLEPDPPPDSDQLTALAAETLPGETLYRDWQLVGNPTRPELFVIGAKQELVEGYLAAFADADIAVSMVDAKPLALIRGIGQRHALIVDNERSVGTVMIVDEAMPRRVRFQLLDYPLLMTNEEKISRLTVALHQVINSYHQGNHAEPLHPAVPVYLTGLLGDEPLLRQAMEAALGLTVGTVSSSYEFPAAMPVAQFIANLGLAEKRS
ncbi:MAG: hypothetical protein KDD73_09630 [Anaerolineales bacterium]|nr:hypothetical protein [Anaerolineales bacterium]MCB9127249.1 hypothetical protein [Ardenticatenales bacterium]MCB9172936.1 hypothetical protein [Ardenticatenales bacterium]